MTSTMTPLFKIVLLTSLAVLTTPGVALGTQYLYTAGNQLEGNTVFGYEIRDNGRLTPLRGSPYSTNGGVGQGVTPFTQNGLVASEDGEFLFVTNLLSNNVTIFRVRHDGSLRHIRNVPTGGDTPASIAISGDVLYVSHLGISFTSCDKCDYRGFRFDRRTKNLIPIPGSVLPPPLAGLSLAIQFAPGGNIMTGTRFFESKIDSFFLDRDTGLLTPALGAPYPTEDTQPIGFAFSPINPNLLIVSNVVELDEKPGTLSSYSFNYFNGTVARIPGGPYTTGGEEAACWVALTSDGRNLYTTNTRSDSITRYKVRRDGTLEFIGIIQVPKIDEINDEPLEIVITPDDRFLYTVNGGVGGIVGFRVLEDGGLELVKGTQPRPLPADTAPYGLVLIEK